MVCVCVCVISEGTMLHVLILCAYRINRPMRCAICFEKVTNEGPSFTTSIVADRNQQITHN